MTQLPTAAFSRRPFAQPLAVVPNESVEPSATISKTVRLAKEASMRLNQLALHNFRKFEDLSVDFCEDVTVLVGGNGFGKSAVLDAAAVALGTYLIYIPKATQRQIVSSDVRIVSRAIGSTIEARPQFPVSVSAKGELFGKKIVWTRELRGQGGKTTFVGARQMTDLSKMVRQFLENGEADSSWDESIKRQIGVLPLVAYYGTGRLWAQASHSDTRGSLRENGYVSALSPKADNNALFQWLRRATLVELQKGKPVPELVAVRRAIEGCLRSATGASDASVYYDVQANSLMVEVRNESGVSTLGFDQLSDGYRTALGMVGDIAYRMAEINPQLGADAASKTSGVVLIDEVDLHLHPRWQATILADLRAAFPRVQFIVSTHSPSVIASVRGEQLRVFGADGSVIVPGVQTYGRDADSVYREILGVPARPVVVQKVFDQAYHALDENRFDDVRGLLDQLASQIGADDPELTGLETSLWLAKDE